MKRLVIIGAGGFGREVLSWARDCQNLPRRQVYIDDNPLARTDARLTAPVVATVAAYEPQKGDLFLCAIGTPAARRITTELISGRGGRFAKLIHPLSKVTSSAEISDGSIICPFGLVSVDAKIGKGAVVYYHSSVDHDVSVGPFCQISGHCDIAGAAVLGAEVFLGTHAAVLPRVIVGDGVVVGAGAIVTKNIAAKQTVAGVPARLLPKKIGMA